MASKVKLQLRQVSDWISTISTAAGSTVELAVESGLLQDTLTDICDSGGIAGSVFKLGAMALPDKFLEADAETRIAFNLSRTFVKTLDEQLKKQGSQFISADAWKKYRQSKIETAAKETLAAEFTWLKVVGISGRKSSRSWPIVHELADFARRIVWEAAILDTQAANNELRQFADDARGFVHEALATTVDKLIAAPVIEDAFRIETPKAAREALGLLAQEFQDLERTYLFNEIPQNALFIPPTVRIADYSQADVETDWNKVEPRPDGDTELCKAIKSYTGRPRVIVITGEMGAGKSCLMRVAAAKLAAMFGHEKSDAVIFVNWRSIYEETNLTEGIARHIKHQYGLPLPDLKNEERLIFLIDGFDEMRSHAPGEVDRYFESLVKLAKDHQSPLIVAMRSTIVTNQVRQQWKNNDVLVVNVDEFGDEAVDAWAEKWCQYRDVTDVSGDSLRKLCRGLSDLVRNPLLLFMLAHYVQPVAKNRETALTRTEIFRTFVDETIAGKARRSGEKASISVVTQKYRLLLQEIAWIASWPRHGGKCPLNILRYYAEQDLEEFALTNLRSAFILHFFKPGENYNEFEFHPEGFRHYLLAEWCVRTQWESLLYDEETPPYPTGRNRAEAMNALAQFPLREVERDLINEIYEQLPTLLDSDDEEEKKQAHIAFGLEEDVDPQKLYKRLCRHANEPPANRWEAITEIGIPDGHSKIKSLQTTRLLTNYWGQAMLATFGLYRGLHKNPKEERIFIEDKFILSHIDLSGFNLSRINLRDANLSRVQGLGTNFEGAVLTGACIEDWNINSETRLDGVICDYIYLKADQQKRRPREGNFKPGEFATLLQQAVDTVDLIFKDGIDWQAFLQSFQDLRNQYTTQDLSIQAIEKKRGDAFVVRVEVAEGADKPALESDVKQLYENQLKTLEAQYEKQLRLKGKHYSEEIQRLISVERQEKATLMGVLTTMASNQGAKVNDMRGAQFGGGFAETVQGNQIGGTINNESAETHSLDETLSLTEATAEIQNLLKPLKASNPTATQSDQIAFLNLMIPPTHRERFISALQSTDGADNTGNESSDGSDAPTNTALEALPYGPLLKALVKSWQSSGSEE